MSNLVSSRWRRAPCDICGNQPSGHVLLGRRQVQIEQRTQSYAWRHEDVQCNRCGFIFNRLRPSASFLHAYYADAWPIFSTSQVIHPDYDPGVRLATLGRWLKPGSRVYEVGDKQGEFQAVLAAEGYVARCDEAMSCRPGRSPWLDGLFGCRTVTPPKSLRMAFDAVVAYFVVEHLANPRPWLGSIRSCLRAGGLLFIEVPHFARHPYAAMMHEHFLYLTPEYLSFLLAGVGYEVMEANPIASRWFGFSLVARRHRMPTAIQLLDIPGFDAEQLRLTYLQGIEQAAEASSTLAKTGRDVANIVRKQLSCSEPMSLCFFGANQTAVDILAQVRTSLGKVAHQVSVRVFDNSDAKQGIRLAGFPLPVEKPIATSLAPRGMSYLWIICSHGWVQDIAQQICSFRLTRYRIMDGAAARELPIGHDLRQLNSAHAKRKP